MNHFIYFFVDFIINGPGDHSFPALLNAIENKSTFKDIKNLIYIDDESNIVKTAKAELLDLDKLPALPYDKLNEFYIS